MKPRQQRHEVSMLLRHKEILPAAGQAMQEVFHRKHFI